MLIIQWRWALPGSSPFSSLQWTHQFELLQFISLGMFPASFQLVVVDFFKLYQCSHLSRNIGSPRFFVLPQSAGGWTFLSLVQDGLFYLWCSNILHFLHNTFIQSFIPWKFSKWIGLALSSGRLSQCMASFPAKVAVSYLADALEAALVINKSYQLVCLCYWTGRDISTHTHTHPKDFIGKLGMGVWSWNLPLL